MKRRFFMEIIDNAPLGKETTYSSTYDPTLLYPIPRALSRESVGIPTPQPFHGVDIWNAYEFSWLNQNGKPKIALVRFYFPSSSINIVESKSLKLYLGSFSQTKFNSKKEIKDFLEKDLCKVVEENVVLDFQHDHVLDTLPGICLDDFNVHIDQYNPDVSLLKTEDEIVKETLHSHLLKSNCPKTGQPDCGSIMIHYIGPKIKNEGLLKYIVSYREYAIFGEYCIEKIFMDLLLKCKPQKLSVYGSYTRRGGIDICPFRSNFEEKPPKIRLIRQ